MLESFSKLCRKPSRNCYANEQPSSETGFKMNVSSPEKERKKQSQDSQCYIFAQADLTPVLFSVFHFNVVDFFFVISQKFLNSYSR